MLDALRRTHRRARCAWQRRRFGARAVVLAYHRVAELEFDPLRLCVSPQTFAQHLDVLRGLGERVRFDGLFSSLETGNGEVVCLTFDDGYADSLLTAKPLLERFEVPATVFVTAGALDADREFWWDELERLLPATDGDGRVPVPPGFGPVHAGEPDRTTWFRVLHDRLYAADAPERERLLNSLAEAQRDDRRARASHRPLRAHEVAALADGGLVEVGAHSITHPHLDRLPAAEQREEIARSKRRLEQLVGQPVTSFAYPHGRYDESAVAAVRRAGFRQACTVEPGVSWRQTHRLRVPRILVSEWPPEKLERRLAHWFGRSPVRRSFR